MFGFSKDSSPAKRKKKRSNLEFDFITGPAPVSRPAAVKKSPPLTVEPKITPGPEEKFTEEPVPDFSTKVEAEIPAKADEPGFSDANHEPEPPKEKQPRMTSPFSEPVPIRPTESIRRQKKEQSTVNTMLNGVVIGIICAIVLITILAGTGSYVIWKQIKGQSATIALLESNTSARLAKLQEDFSAENQKLGENLALTNQQIVDLNKQLADAQKTIDTLRRAQAQAQKRLDDQADQLNRLRSTRQVR
jgi:hypothetical protein